MPDIFNSANHHPDAGSTTQPANSSSSPSKHVDEYSDVLRQESVSTNPLDAFAAKPRNVCFDAQLQNEHVVLLLRRHPVTQIPWILIALLMAFFPWLMGGIFNLDSLLPARYVFAAFLGWEAMVFSFALESFLVWFFNVNVVTDERVIDVDFNSLIYKNISAAKLDNLEDITAETGGAVRAIFDFGTIKLQTAAAVTEFEFEDVPHPAKVTALLNEMLLEEEREKAEGRVN